MNEAFFFGPSNQQIFANYHPPVSGFGQVLTVICPPLFNEYMRTQGALRDLAVSLSESGQHVLRFDYRGTGDSFGDLNEVTLSDWIDDIALAVREGCEVSGCGAARLLGVRFGALLACKSMAACREVQRVVLWDPVDNGVKYLEELRHIQEKICEEGLSLSSAQRQQFRHEHAGYQLSESMEEEFRSLDASAYSNVPANMLQVVSTTPDAVFTVAEVPQEIIRFACNWDTNLDDLLMPKPVLERLSKCLTTA